jgi:hypothetical protein
MSTHLVYFSGLVARNTEIRLNVFRKYNTYNNTIYCAIKTNLQHKNTIPTYCIKYNKNADVYG